MHKLILSLGILAAACGGGEKKAETPAAPAAATSGVTLGLAEMKLMDANKGDAVLIHADGGVEYQGKVVAKVTADGKLLRTDTGAVVMELQPDGSIKAADGAGMPPVKIAPDGSVSLDGKTVSIDDKGNLVGANQEGPQMKIEGATDAAKKRTAMFVLLALTMPGPRADEPGTSGPPPAPAEAPKPAAPMPMPKK